MADAYSIDQLVKFLTENNNPQNHKVAIDYWESTLKELEQPCSFKLCDRLLRDFKVTEANRYQYAASLAKRILELYGEFESLSPTDKYNYLELRRIVSSCYRWTSEYTKAKEELTVIIKLAENSKLALSDQDYKKIKSTVHNILAGIYKSLGKYPIAIKEYQTSIEYNSLKYTPLRNIADIYHLLGDFDKAINTAKEAIKDAEIVLNKNHKNNKFHKSPIDKFDFFVNSNLEDKAKKSFLLLYLNIGIIYRKYGVYLSKENKKNSLDYFALSEKYFNALHKHINNVNIFNDTLKSILLLELTALYFNLYRSKLTDATNKQQYLELSEKYCTEGINIFQNQFLTERFRLGEFYHFQGLIYEANNNINQAIDSWNHSLKHKYDNNQYYASADLIAKTYFKLADIHKQINADTAKQYYESALKFYDEASIYHSLNEFTQNWWQEEYITCVKNYIDMLYNLKLNEEALRFVDFYACRNLKLSILVLEKLEELLNNKEYSKLFEKVNNLKTRINDLNDIDPQNKDKSTFTELYKLYKDLNKANEELKNMQVQLLNENPNLRNYLIQDNPKIVKQIQNIINDKQRILLFFDTQDRIAINLISKQNIKVYLIDKTEFPKIGNNVSTKLNKLYKLLISPFQDYLSNIEHLFIIPSESTINIPWGALKTNNNEYLVQLYSLSIAPSLNVLNHMYKLSKRNNSLSQPMRLIIFADPIFEHHQRLEITNSTAVEISQQCQNVYSEVKLYTGKQASKANLINEINNNKNALITLLIMTHGDYQGKDGKLFLTDGELTSLDFVDLNLSNIRQAIILACRAGRHQIAKSLSFNGLVTSMIAAGCPSVICATSDINEANSCMIIKELFVNKTNANTINSLEFSTCLRKYYEYCFDEAIPFVIYSFE